MVVRGGGAPVGLPEFEWDPAKSASNKIKHGIDFDEATGIWKDDARTMINVDRTDEPRFLMVGLLNGKVWTAVATTRGEVIRIISVRRSRKEEVAQYGQQ